MDGCQIPIPTHWNVDLFEKLLCDYQDKEIVKFFRFGWPIDVTEVKELPSVPVNQQGASDNMGKVQQYVVKEVNNGSVIGPFSTSPLPGARFSPLDAIPKKDSVDLRIIMNLSYPHDETSVNAALDKDKFLGRDIDLKYPSLWNLVEIIKKKGKGSLLFKRDLKKFYRQVGMDLGVIHLLGFSVRGDLYVDVVLSMGLRIACYIAQHISDAIMFLYRKMSYEGVNYIDDLGGCEVTFRVEDAFALLGELLNRLGIWEAVDKASPPATVMTFLGVLCNSENFTLQITLERMEEIRNLMDLWLNKQWALLKEVQSLAGKINFVCYTVHCGRVFLVHILQFLHSFEGKPGRRKVDAETRKDVRWWKKFLHQFNGISMFPHNRWSPPDFNISTDSCLSGLGGWSHGSYFHGRFPEHIANNTDLTINELECLAVVVAVKLWANRFVNANLLMFCDNSSTVEVINGGRAKHWFTQTCLRELV